MRRVDLVLVAWALLSLVWLAAGYRTEKPRRPVLPCAASSVAHDLDCYDKP